MTQWLDLAIMSTVTQKKGATARINPSARTRVGRKRTLQKALASPASNMVVLNGELGREKRLWEPSCRENASKSQIALAVGNSVPFYELAHRNLPMSGIIPPSDLSGEMTMLKLLQKFSFLYESACRIGG
jgi:hypothetical protein